MSPQRLRSFWSAPRIATSGNVQFCMHVQSNHFIFSANQIVRLDSELVQSDGKSVNCGFLVLDLPRGHVSWCWSPKGVCKASGDKNVWLAIEQKDVDMEHGKKNWCSNLVTLLARTIRILSTLTYRK